MTRPKNQVAAEKEARLQVMVYDDIVQQWVQRFLRRHPELASVRPRSIDAVGVKDTSPEQLQHWFDDFEKVLAEFNIKPENIYNKDESGVAIGEKEAGRCISNARVRQQFHEKLGASGGGFSVGVRLCRWQRRSSSSQY